MSNLRQAAEALLNHWEAGEYKNCTGYMAGHVRVLREALAHEALDRMVAENQKLGLYDDDLQTAIERGTKAWADVPANWVEKLRGNDTPEVAPEVTPEVFCKTHPDAPHGFDRNASHSADRYVCECESWEPVDAVNMSQERVDETAKDRHISYVCPNCHWSLDKQVRTHTPEDVKKIESKWVGLTDHELQVLDFNDPERGKLARAVEARLKEKNT